MTLQEKINQFLIDQDVNAQSRQSYGLWLRQYKKWLSFAGINPSTVRKADILKFKNYLVNKYADKTVNCYLSAVRLFYAWDHYTNHTENPTTGIKLIRLTHQYRKDPLTIPQAATLLNSCNLTTPTGLRIHTMILLMLTTGLRAIEVSRLTTTDLIGHDLHIQGKGHTDKDITITLPPDVVQHINKIKGLTYIFETVTHKPIKAQYISKMISQQMRVAGIKTNKISCHSLRHTGAVLALEQSDNNIFDVKQFMRHTSTRVTEDYLRSISINRTRSNRISHDISDLITQATKQC